MDIIPYDEYLINTRGAFINPNGKIMYISTIHEDYARKICFGNSHKLENYDEYSGSLNIKDYKLLKLWLEHYNKHEYNIAGNLSDFLVYVLQYDKVEVLRENTIITTSQIPHIRFYNYYIMDYNIIESRRIIYNEKENKFKLSNYVPNSIDIEEEKEINEIKTKVLKKDRHIFLKS